MANTQENVLINFEVDYSQLTSAQQELAKTGKIDTKVFDAIQAAIDTTATDSKGLIKTFKDVAQASVKMGKTVEDAFGAGVQDALDEAGVSVEEFASALKKTTQPATSVKKELALLKSEMAKLKAEGKDTGKEFDSLRQRAGKLADAIADANAEIKNAGSDTKGLDNVVGSISALAGGYAAVQGAAALFGEENEDLQKALLKVNGAMALAQGLQQTLNALQKEGALTKLADATATGLQSAATAAYTFVMGGATVATRVFRAALIATGIGAIVVLVLSLVSALIEYSESADDGTLSTEDFNKALEKQNQLLKENIDQLEASGRLNASRLKGQGRDALAIALEEIKLRKRVLTELEAAELQARKDAVRNRQTENKEAIDNIRDLGDKIQQERDRIALLQSETINLAAELDKKSAEDALKKRQELQKKTEEAIKKATALELSELDKKVKAQLAALDKEEEQTRIHFENEQDIIERGRAEGEAINKKWDDLRLEQMAFLTKASEEEAAKRKKAAEDEKARIEKQRDAIISVANQVAAVFASVSDLQTQRDQAFLAGKRRAIDEELRAGAITLKAAEARQKQLDDLERRQKNKAAQRDKQLAVFQALIAVPQAYLTGLKTSLPLAIIMGALAAVQAALVISRPVPKFFRGKKDRYEGPGIVGDMGTELVEQNGRMFLYTKPTQTYLGANDKVYTAAETRQIMHNTNISTTVKQQPAAQFDYKQLGAAIPKNSISINIDKDFISESVADGLKRTNYMDRRYSSK